MKHLPQGRDAWFGFALLPFKVWVVAVPVWRFAASVGSDRLTAQYFSGDLVTVGAMLCLPVLLLGALAQAAFCSRGQMWWTLGFVAFGFLFGPPSRLGMSPSLANNASLALSVLVVGFAVSAYCRLKWRLLLLLAGGSLLGIATRLAYEFVGPAETDYTVRRVVLEVGPVSSLTAHALVTVGIVQLLRKVMKDASPKPPPSPAHPE